MPGTVSVCCKLPHGLVLRIYEMDEFHEAVMGGGTRKSSRARRIDAEFVLRGTATPPGQPPKILAPGGFAITHNVDADFFAKWLEQNAGSELVKKRIIFAHQKADSAEQRAKDNADVTTGMEPVDPKNPQKRLGGIPSKISLELVER